MNDFGNPDENYYGDGLVTSSNAIDGSVFHMGSNFLPMDSNIDAFVPQGTFPGPNDDLNSFFTPGEAGPGKGILSFGNLNESDSVPQGRWDNGDALQMFGQQPGFPFPVQDAPAQEHFDIETSTVKPSWIGAGYTAVPIENSNSSVPVEEQSNSPEEVEKRKRGRPRKRKRKDPLSEEEQRKKREAFLERNRRAASKCRKRKKESTENIQTRANNLDKESRMLAAELMQVRAEHARWLSMVIAHAKACPDNSIFQSYLKSEATPLGDSSAPVSMARAADWDDSQSNTIIVMDESSASGPMSSPNACYRPLSEIDFVDLYTNNPFHDGMVKFQDEMLGEEAKESLLMSREPSQQSMISQCSGHLPYQQHQADPTDITGKDSQKSDHSTTKSMQKLHLDTTMKMSRQRSRESMVMSPASTQMSRENSISSASAGTRDSNRDSAYCSTSSTTPEEYRPAPPAEETFDGENLATNHPMMRNQRISKRTEGAGGAGTPAEVSEQLELRRLRSRKKLASGLADLSDPSIYIAEQSKR